jgi:hypothetical protein
MARFGGCLVCSRRTLGEGNGRHKCGENQQRNEPENLVAATTDLRTKHWPSSRGSRSCGVVRDGQQPNSPLDQMEKKKARDASALVAHAWSTWSRRCHEPDAQASRAQSRRAPAVGLRTSKLGHRLCPDFGAQCQVNDFRVR